MNYFNIFNNLNKKIWFNIFSLNGVVSSLLMLNILRYPDAGIIGFILVILFACGELLSLCVWIYESSITFEIKNKFFLENKFIKFFRYLGVILNFVIITFILAIFVINK